MPSQRPGLNPQRLVRLMREAVARSRLSLAGRVVLTEGASGAYVVTPVLAALAGAKRVYALIRPTRYGTVEQVRSETHAVARHAGVQERIVVITRKSPELVAQADVITNSGHLRPIDAETIGWMKPTAVVPLMYEAWELRPQDIDLAACRRRGIAVGGTNERHPAVNVFAYLGALANKLLHDAGVAVYASRILLLCANPFAGYIESGLRVAGARVDTVEVLSDAPRGRSYDAILVAQTPGLEPAMSAADVALVHADYPGSVVAQFWGDLDRTALTGAAVPFWPLEPPPPGHMGVLPSEIGPEPVVLLQTGGLKVAQVLSEGPAPADHESHEFVEWVSPEDGACLTYC